VTQRLLIATPVRGALPEAAPVSLGWSEATRRLSRDTSIDIDVLGFGCDLVRTRSRIVRMVLDKGGYHAILWWDDDVIPRDMSIIRRMLETGHDLVAAPYPQKLVNWEGAGYSAMSGHPPEWGAYKYPFHREATRGDVVCHQGCIDVDHIGMGFMLTTTTMLQKMWDAYAPTLSFGDVTQGRRHHTVALFQLMMPAQAATPPYAVGPMLSEDYSFCTRALAQGYQPQLYVGEGSPVDHVGYHVFRGHRHGLNGSGLQTQPPDPAPIGDALNPDGTVMR
jgi:hypothetical protein